MCSPDRAVIEPFHGRPLKTAKNRLFLYIAGGTCIENEYFYTYYPIVYRKIVFSIHLK